MASAALGHSEFTVIGGTEAWAGWQHDKDFVGELKHGLQRKYWIRSCLTSLPYLWLSNFVEPVLHNSPGLWKHKMDELRNDSLSSCWKGSSSGTTQNSAERTIPRSIYWKSVTARLSHSGILGKETSGEWNAASVILFFKKWSLKSLKLMDGMLSSDKLCKRLLSASIPSTVLT